MTEFVADSEATPSRPLNGFFPVHPDLTRAGEEESRQGSLGIGSSWRSSQVVYQANAEAEAGVDDVFDGDRKGLAVPDVLGYFLQDRSGLGLDRFDVECLVI